MVWAKALSIQEDQPPLKEEDPWVFVQVETETSLHSALYPASETAFYLIFEETEKGAFLIDRFVTG